MQQESGYCDRCGAVLVGSVQLTVDDGELCEDCVADDKRWSATAARNAERSDGR